MIHLIQIDRDGFMSFACDTIELFTEQGATREIFRVLAQTPKARPTGQSCCQYCMRILVQGNSGVE